MAWRIEFDPGAFRDLEKLDKKTQRRIIKFFRERIATAENPRKLGKALKDNKEKLWRYRVGDYRIICAIKDKSLLVLVLRLGHRKSVYD